MKWNSALVIGLVGMLLFNPAVAETILVIKSNDNRFFDTTIKQLGNQLTHHVDIQSVTLQDGQLPEASRQDSDLIITLGHEALKRVSELSTQTPVLHAYVTAFQIRQHAERKGHSSLVLDLPFDHYLRLARLLLSPKTIGLLSSGESILDHGLLQKVGNSNDIQIFQSRLDSDENLITALRHLLRDVDLLLAMPDPEIYNRKTLKGILLTTYRMSVPVISYSPSHVKSGALAAIFTSPENVGTQLADLSARILNEPGFTPKHLYYPSRFDISINENVAESLNLTLPPRGQLLQALREEGAQ